MKFLVYGSEGWVGSAITEIIRNAGDEVAIGRRISTIEDVKSDINMNSPQYVICCLARPCGPGINPTVDYLEQKGKLKENIFANLTAPLLLAQATALLSGPHIIPVWHIGSGCIFEYNDAHPQGTDCGYTEKDIANFSGSSYSIVKGQTDQIMKNFPHVLSARIRMPITEHSHPRDFITKVLGYERIISVPNSMSVLEDILPIVVACFVDGKRGAINAVNPGIIDHQQIVKLYEEISGLSHVYDLMTIEEQNQILLAGRSNNYLDSSLLERWHRELPSHLRTKYRVLDKLAPIEERIRRILSVREKDRQAPSKARVMLVTGGCGFIGSNFINYWVKQYPDDTIVNLDSLELSANPKNIENPSSCKYHFVCGNLLDQSLIAKLFEDFQLTHVVHFAAASNVDKSFSHPMDCTRSNVLGTHVLLEVVRQHRTVELFVHISTDEVYGEITEGANSETNLFLPTNPYAATKAAAECLVMSYRKSYHIPYVITRANNAYGPYRYPAQAIPKFTFLLLRKRKMPVHGNGHAVRHFLHVQDKCTALDAIIRKGKNREIYNIGTTDEVSVLQICELLLKEVLEPGVNIADWVEYVPDRPYTDCRYSIEFSKLKALGWSQTIPFEEGIRNTVDWYRKNQEHWGVNGHLDEAFRASDHSSDG